MVDCKAEWLYTLPQWDNLLTGERRKELYKEQKASGTIVKEKKVGRNDPCPCGSGNAADEMPAKNSPAESKETLNRRCIREIRVINIL